MQWQLIKFKKEKKKRRRRKKRNWDFILSRIGDRPETMYYGVLKKERKNTQIHECRTVTNKEIQGILFYPESATGLRLCSRECYNNALLLLFCFFPRMIAEDYRS